MNPRAVAEAVTNGFGFDSLHGLGTGQTWKQASVKKVILSSCTTAEQTPWHILLYIAEFAHIKPLERLWHDACTHLCALSKEAMFIAIASPFFCRQPTISTKNKKERKPKRVKKDFHYEVN